MYDIAIVGAGPAGATLARLLPDAYKVLLIEKGQLTDASSCGSSGKCCGGLLAPDAQGMLSKMGLGLPKSVLVDPQLFVVRAIDVPRRLERYYQRYYINMDRHKFDLWLASMIPSSIDVRPGCRFKSYELETNRVKVTFVHNNKTCTEHARILVGADGASSKVRRQAVPNYPFPKAYFAIQEWVEADGQLPYFSTIFDPEITDYYCWTIPKEDYLIIGAALRPRDEVRVRFELLKTKLKKHGFRFGRTIRRKAAFILRPTKTRQLSVGTSAIVLLGEAGGWISPSSAEGLSYAFRTALLFAQVLRESPENFQKLLCRRTRQLRRNIFLKNIKSDFIYKPCLRNIIMRTGLQSMEVYRKEVSQRIAPE